MIKTYTMVITRNICLVFISAHCKHWKLLSNLCLGPISIFILRLPPSDIHPNCRKPIKIQFMMFNSWICSAHGNNISPLLDNVSLPSSLLAHYKHYKILVTFPPLVLKIASASPALSAPWLMHYQGLLIIFHFFSKHLSLMSSHCDCVVPKNTYRGYINWFWTEQIFEHPTCKV